MHLNYNFENDVYLDIIDKFAKAMKFVASSQRIGGQTQNHELKMKF